MTKTSLHTLSLRARRLIAASLSCPLVLFSVDAAIAQRGQSGPPEHADVAPVNDLPNPYQTERDWGVLPDGRTWGSVSAVNVDVDGTHIWAADRCGANSCAESNVAPIVKLDTDGNVVAEYPVEGWPMRLFSSKGSRSRSKKYSVGTPTMSLRISL